VIRDLGAILREYKEPLGELVSLEMGKIRAEGEGEVQEMIDICDFAVGLSRQLYGLTMHSERPAHRMYEQWHPLGPIGIITAFNFPVAVWSWNATIAAVCGDTLIWKPSELTPLCGAAVQHLANRVMADHGLTGIFNLAVGAGDIGQRMAEDSRLPLISFTGSIPTGRRVAQTVAGRLGRPLLELGGNNAIIVSDKADLDLAVRAISLARWARPGQRCTSTRRIIAHAAIVDELSRAPGQGLSTGADRRPVAARRVDGAARHPPRRGRDAARRRARGGRRRRGAHRRQGAARHRRPIRRTDDHPNAGADRDRARGDLCADPLHVCPIARWRKPSTCTTA
jgi:acyl-CoA reductase-like NAD-dependent aldehyde dehydrogenase